jgi:peptide/nickel transport system permease protein
VTIQAYIARRLLLVIPLTIGVTLATFVVSHLVPSDPVVANLSDAAQGDPQIVKAFRQEWGLDRPLYQQYLDYLGNIARGNFGVSIQSHRPIIDDLRQYLPATVELAVSAMVLSVLLGIPLGVISAARRERLVDRVVRTTTLVGASAPIFWLALMALYVFYARLGWFPPPGRLDTGIQPPPPVTGLLTVDAILVGRWDVMINALKHLALPALVLGFHQMAYIVRVTRSSMLEVIAQEYIRTARAKGVGERLLLYRHALRNALIPTVTYIGLAFGSLLSGTVIAETVFSWPGVGRYAFQSATSLDFPAIVSVVTVIAMIYIAVNLSVDVLHVAIDPRIRTG